MVVKVLLIICGYLCGSICFAYLAGRLCRAIDLRQYGSRKLSASNVYEYLGFPGMALVGIADIAKAALPTWLVLYWGYALPIAVLVGLAAMVGHNWSLYLGLKGGRGIGAAMGLLLVVFPLGVLWVLVWVALGRLKPHAAAVPALLGLISLPILAGAMGQPTATVWACLGMLLITIAKRIEGNREELPAGDGARAVLWRRLFLDRDISDFDVWARQTPIAD